MNAKYNGPEVLSLIKDTGIGIRKENFDQIFQRFSKFNESKMNMYAGTGIGQFLSKHLVSLLGGKIWFESEYQSGSSFYFTIPKKR